MARNGGGSTAESKIACGTEISYSQIKWVTYKTNPMFTCLGYFDFEQHSDTGNTSSGDTCKTLLSSPCPFPQSAQSTRKLVCHFMKQIVKYHNASYGISSLLVLVIDLPPVRGPFPHIADHIVEPVLVRREGIHRSGRFKPVVSGVFFWKCPLPDVSPDAMRK